MRVDTLTLATAALTIGLASPALASPTLGDYQGLRTQASVQRGGGGDCGDNEGCGDSFTSHRHCGSGASCRGLFGRGPLSGFGGGFGGGGGDWGGGGGGDRVEWGESGAVCCAAKHAHAHVAVPSRLARPGRMVVHRRQVVRIPRHAVPTGFGGGQGMNLPLGIAGLSLILGGAGLLPLARRRIRASERS